MQKNRYAAAVGYLVAFLLLLVFSLAELYVSPFGTGFYLGLVFSGMSAVVVTPLYVAASVIASPSVHTLIGCGTVSAVVAVAEFIRYKLKKPMPQWARGLVALLSQAGYAYVMLSSTSVVSTVLSVFFALVFMYLSALFLRPVYVEKLRYKLLEPELIAGGILLCAFVLGLSGLYVYKIPVSPAVVLLIVCVAGYCGGMRAGLVTGICSGVGLALRTFDVSMIAAFAFVALVASLFTAAPRILSALSGVLGYVMVIFFFDMDYSAALWWIISLTAGGVVYALLPKKLLRRAAELFSTRHSKVAMRHMVNRSRLDLGNSLVGVGNIFSEMGAIMAAGASPVSDKHIRAIAENLENSVCARCEKAGRCRDLLGLDKAFCEVTRASLDHGRLCVKDIPPVIADNCIRMAQLISVTGALSEEYLKKAQVKKSEDAAKSILSKQLAGLSDIMRTLGERTAEPLSYDFDREKAVVEELTYRGIVCSEALVAGTAAPTSATLIVRSECVDKAVIEKVLKRVMRTGFSVTSVSDSALAGWCIVYASVCPRYEAVFGAANCPKIKGEPSGDTHSFIKISGHKFMTALCDGMGSGERGAATSETAISLIENFYKAGFDNKLVLESVNKFLAVSSEEAFSAIDICVVDLETGDCDVIKIGTPATYIKNSETVLRIDGSALPLGVLDEMRPFVSTRRLKGGETVVLATDGVSDAFEGDELANFINNVRTVNPQLLAGSVLEKALSNVSDCPRDDMSVVTLRLIERV